MTDFHYSSMLPATSDVAFAWHEKPGAFQRLSPPWKSINVLEQRGTIHDGDELLLRIKVGPVKINWLARHQNFQAGKQFEDVQVRGPFASWIHNHRFESTNGNSCRLHDQIEYRFPVGKIGAFLAGKRFSHQMKALFEYRHRQTKEDLELFSRYSTERKLKVAVTGSSGMVGSALCALLGVTGHDVIRLIRTESKVDKIDPRWDPAKGILDAENLEGIDAVIHLAGENLANRRWSPKQMAEIRDSRVNGTKNLITSLLKLKQPPKTFICASAIGYYGDRGEERLTENSECGDGFLSQVVQDWEHAALSAADHGVRVVLARLGVVLDPRGGALSKMLLPFRLGLGGSIGHGRQTMSWVSLDDAIGAIYHVLMKTSIDGPVNIVAPNPTTNRHFARALGRVLRRPAIAPLPALAAKALFGKMAKELLLAGTHVTNGKLSSSGFRYRDPELGPALSWMLGCGSTSQ